MFDQLKRAKSFIARTKTREELDLSETSHLRRNVVINNMVLNQQIKLQRDPNRATLNRQVSSSHEAIYDDKVILEQIRRINFGENNSLEKKKAENPHLSKRNSGDSQSDLHRKQQTQLIRKPNNAKLNSEVPSSHRANYNDKLVLGQMRRNNFSPSNSAANTHLDKRNFSTASQQMAATRKPALTKLNRQVSSSHDAIYDDKVVLRQGRANDFGVNHSADKKGIARPSLSKGARNTGNSSQSDHLRKQQTQQLRKTSDVKLTRPISSSHEAIYNDKGQIRRDNSRDNNSSDKKEAIHPQLTKDNKRSSGYSQGELKRSYSTRETKSSYLSRYYQERTNKTGK